MVSAYTMATVLWLFVWQYFANREIGIRLWSVLLDIVPYIAVSLIVMTAIYYATMTITNMYLLLVVRILLAALLYFIVMKLLKSKMLDECVGFLLKKRRK